MIYLDAKNKEFFLSVPTLKRDLSLLENRQTAALEDISLSSLDANLLIFFNKINFSIKKVTFRDVNNFLKNKIQDTDVLTFIFSLNKLHTFAIVYLLYENLIDEAKVRKLIKVSSFTRSEVLTSYLEQSEENIYLFDKFFDYLDSFFNYNRTPEAIPNGIVDFGLVNVSSRAVPDQYYFLSKLLSKTTQTGYSGFNSFSSVIWDANDKAKNRGPDTIEYNAYAYFRLDVTKAFMDFLGITDTSLGILALVYTIALILLNPFTAAAALTYFGTKLIGDWLLYRDYNSFLDLLNKTSSYKDSFRPIESKNFSPIILNKFYGELVRKTTRDRLSNIQKESNGFSTPDSLLEFAIREGVSDAISDDVSKPTKISYFNYLYWMYNNTSNIRTINNFSFELFNNIASNYAFRQSGNLNPVGLYTLAYLDGYPAVRDFIKDIFPDFQNLPRSDINYINNYFINRNSSTVSEKSNLSTNFSSISPKLNALMKLDVIAENNGKIRSLGGGGRKSYVLEAVRNALNALNYTNLDISQFSSMGSVETYMAAMKTSIIQKINDQTKTPVSGANVYNRYLAEDETNFIFRSYLTDIIGQFFDYLVNGSAGTFSPVLSSASMNIYILLNFVKHTFINIDKFTAPLKNHIGYKNLLVLIFSLRNNFEVADVKDIYRGGVSISELESLFNYQNQSNNSAQVASTTTITDGPTSTGGGGSGVRVR